MSNFLEKAISIASVNPSHLVPTSEHQFVDLQHDEGGMRVAEYQATSINSSEQRIHVQPQTQINPALLSAVSTQTDFVIHPGMNLEIDEIYHSIIINNASGGDIRFIPEFLIGPDSTYRDNGKEVYLRFSGRDLYLDNAYDSYLATVNKEATSNVSATNYRSAVVQATGTTKEYLIRLPGCFRGLQLGALDQDLRFRINYVPSNALESGTWTGVTVQSAQIILSGSERTEADFNHTRTIYRDSVTHHRYSDWVTYMQTRQVSANSTQTYQLDSIVGISPLVFVYAENDGDAPYLLGTDDLIASISLKDQSGKSVTPQESNAYLRTVLATKYFDSAFFSKVNVIPLIHSRAPQLTHMSGVQTGYYPYSGHDKLEVVYNSSVVSGSHSLYAHARIYKAFVIANGKLRVGN